MKKQNDVLIILSGLFLHLCSIASLFLFFKDVNILIILGIYVGSLALFFSTKTKYAYVVLILYILGYAIAQTLYIWLMELNPNIQFEFVLKNILVLLSAISLWLVIYLLKKTQLKIQEYLNIIKENEKYVKISNVLTSTEIEYRLKSLLTNLSRHKQRGYIILIKIDDAIESYKSKPIFDILGKAWIKNIRGNYDLVGKINDKTLLVAIQNSNNEGLSIVMNRFFETLRQAANIDTSLFTIYTLDILNYVENKRNSDESFSNFDVMDIDLFSGEVSKEMIKYAK